MRHLLLAPLILLLSSCSYKSQAEAYTACWEWVKQGGKYSHFYKAPSSTGRRTTSEGERYGFKLNVVWRRWCTHEETTRQYLGREYINRKKPTIITGFEKIDKDRKSKITNHFRY